MKMHFFKIFKFLCIGFILISSISCQKFKPYTAKHTFYRMDTVWEVTVVVPGKIAGFSLRNIIHNTTDKFVNRTWEAVDSFLMDYETRFSQTSPKSELLSLNSTKAKKKSISPDLCQMLKIALRYGGDSLGGMFDVTILPVKNLWGLGENCTLHVVPSPDTLRAVMQHVNYKKLFLDTQNNTIACEDTNVTIDVGGIAKKHSLHKIALLLESLGYESYLLNAGGDITARGKKPDGKSWRIGIQHPRPTDKNSLLAVFDLDSGSAVTSGDYERFWIHDGIRVHHIFNSKTGYSCTNHQSVTIWTKDPEMADVLSTGLFCMSTDSIMAFVEKRPYIQCVVVDSAGNIFVSSGWKDEVHFQN